jgi:hypothetical protein
MGRRFMAAGITVSALLLVSFSSSAAFAATGSASATSADNPTQTQGSATFYGTSAPLGLTTAPASSARASAPTGRDSRNAHVFAPRAAKAAKSKSTLLPPSPAGTPVVSSPGGATGFNGLSHADQRLAGTGIYVNTQFSLEPPDQGLCVGKGFVVEPINLAFAVLQQERNGADRDHRA